MYLVQLDVEEETLYVLDVSNGLVGYTIDKQQAFKVEEQEGLLFITKHRYSNGDPKFKLVKVEEQEVCNRCGEEQGVGGCDGYCDQP